MTPPNLVWKVVYKKFMTMNKLLTLLESLELLTNGNPVLGWFQEVADQ